MAKHDHVVNGISPVKGCAVCDKIVRSSQYNEDKEPEGRQAPWLWGKDDK